MRIRYTTFSETGKRTAGNHAKAKKHPRQEQLGGDPVLSPPKKHAHSEKDKKRNPVLDDADLVFSNTENRRSHSKKKKK